MMSAPFMLLPAVDIRAGRCVRLYQGDYARETVFDSDPLAAIARWLDAGAEIVHVVDLDGARGEPDVNRTLLGVAVARFPARLQIGGGIRTLARAQELVDTGAGRIVLGSAAIRDPSFGVAACRRWPDRVLLDVATRAGHVTVQGWTEEAAQTVAELLDRYRLAGLRWLVYTDIERDGTGAGPNIDAVRTVARMTTVGVIASGGISTTAQIVAARDAGAAGAIIGRALYDGSLSFAEAQNAVSSVATLEGANSC